MNNGAIHKRRSDFPPCFFCSPAWKRPSMTSSLATVKTFEGPDGSAPDYWVFLSPASKGKFSCSLSPYLYKVLSTFCLLLLHQWQRVCTSMMYSSQFCDWLKGFKAIKKPGWRKSMQWSIRWMNLKVGKKLYYWVLVSCQSTKFVGRKHQVYSTQVTRNCRRECFMHSCVAKNSVKTFIFVIVVPGDSTVVVWCSTQEVESYTKSCGHVGKVILHENHWFQLRLRFQLWW